jgi:hypothetical protein
MSGWQSDGKVCVVSGYFSDYEKPGTRIEITDFAVTEP